MFLQTGGSLDEPDVWNNQGRTTVYDESSITSLATW